LQRVSHVRRSLCRSPASAHAVLDKGTRSAGKSFPRFDEMRPRRAEFAGYPVKTLAGPLPAKRL